MFKFGHAPGKRSETPASSESNEGEHGTEKIADLVLASALDSIPDGFAVYDAEERLVYFNRAYREQTLAVIADKLRLGVTFNELAREIYRRGRDLQPDSPELDRLVADARRRHTDLPSDCEIEWTQGRWMRESKQRLETGHVVATFTDITDIKRAEFTALDNHRRFIALIDSSPDGIVVVCDDKYVIASPRAAAMLGWDSPADLIGRTALDFIASDQRDAVLRHRRELMDSKGGSVHGRVNMLRRDVTELPVSYWMSPVDWEGQAAFLVLLRDETEAEQTRDALIESEAFFRNITENIPGMVYQRRIEADGSITYPYVSGAAVDISGFSADEIVRDPQKLIHSIHPDDRDTYLAGLRSSFAEMAQHSADIRYNHPVRGLRWLHTISRPRCRVDGTLVAEAVAFDITDRKTTEEQLEDNRQRLNDHIVELQDTRDRLEQRSSELIRTISQLAEARDAAEAANRAKSDFLATMSHEIRTPMNGVLGMASLLAQTGLSETQQDYLDTIRMSGEALLDIINDILDYSKMEAGQLKLEEAEFSVAEVLDGAVQLLRPKYAQKDLTVRTFIARSVPEMVIGDPGRLRQILINLIGNAVKFTETGSISIDCVAAESFGRHLQLRFSIADTGIGIDEAHQKHLFESFSQADASTTRRYGGTGLGLSICKRLCALMDGEISVESTAGVGSVFHFSVRCGIAGQRELPWPTAESQASSYKAMIISSTGQPDTGITRQLCEYGFRIISPEEAVRQPAVDLVIVDQQSTIGTSPVVQAMIADSGSHPPSVWVISRGPADLQRNQSDNSGERHFELPLRQTLLRAAARKIHHTPAAGAKFSSLSTAPAKPGAASEAAREDDPAPALNTGQAGSGGISILLVEDNPVNQRVTLALLHGTPASVTVAENGRKGFEAVRDGTFDVVLMDIHMPEMDGIEATQAIRDLPAPKCDIPIVALTANAMAGDREKYLAAGMNDYVSKPIDPALLKAAIGRQAEGWLERSPPAPPSEAQAESRDLIRNTGT